MISAQLYQALVTVEVLSYSVTFNNLTLDVNQGCDAIVPTVYNSTTPIIKKCQKNRRTWLIIKQNDII